VEPRAKERLTGAIILVAVIVLLVPELLSGPRGPAKPAAAPADGPAVRSFKVDLREEPRASTAQAGAAQPSAAQSAQAEQAAAAPQPVASAPAAAPAVPADAAAANPEAGSAHAPAHPAETHAPAVVHPSAAGTWSVQLGSFASEENAQRLAGELRSKGFHTSVSEGTGAGHRWYRVRVGPERDRPTAQAIAGRLRALGHPGSIVPSS